ncbi:MAG TPA: sulfotransferase [Gaiellaceae bacterium]|nr:sulfotransferase [Gaiellaceae bacterium]
MLPQFLVIGAYKSGSTAIQEALRTHPQVFLPGKGPSFFAFDEAPEIDRPLLPHTVRDWEAYQALFADAPADAVRGEVSPEYMANPWACGRIRTRVPDVKLVAVLRNPVERAFSDYLMYVRDGDEKLDFAAALDEQEERRRAGSPTGYYLETGFYGRQLRPYFEAFSRERIQVHLFEDFAADPDSVLEPLYAFLGVDPALGTTLERAVNVSGVPRNALVGAAVRGGKRVAPLLPEAVRRRAKSALVRGLDRPTLSPGLRARLVDLYREDIAELERLLERPLGRWLEAGGGQ